MRLKKRKKEKKTGATGVKRSQLEEVVGASWAALAVEDGPQERVIGALLVKAGEREGEEARGGGGVGRTMRTV